MARWSSCLPSLWRADVREVGIPMGDFSACVLDRGNGSVSISVLRVRETNQGN